MNKVFLIGRLTADPDLRYVKDGKAFARYSLAVRRRYKSRDGNFITDFINCVSWVGAAEYISHAKKGDMIAVIGELHIDKWTDVKGVSRKSVTVAVNEITRLTYSNTATAENKSNDTNRTNTNYSSIDFETEQSGADPVLGEYEDFIG